MTLFKNNAFEFPELFLFSSNNGKTIHGIGFPTPTTARQVFCVWRKPGDFARKPENRMINILLKLLLGENIGNYGEI